MNIIRLIKKIRSISTIINHKINFMINVCLLFIQSLLEVCSIALIFPLILSFVNKDKVHSYISEIDFLQNFNVEFVLPVAIFIFFVCKSIISTKINHYLVNFAFNFQARISNFLFQNYLTLDYLDFSKRSPSMIIQAVGAESRNFAYIILNLFYLHAEILFIFFMLFLLMVFNPQIILILLAIVSLLIGISFITLSNKLKKLGRERVKNDQVFFSLIKDTFENFKIIKTYIKELFYIKNFFEVSFKTARLISFQTFLLQLPKIWIEFIAVTLFLIIVSFYQHYSYSKFDENFIILLAVYAAAFVKMLPSINRIIYTFQYLLNNVGVIDFIIKELKSKGKKINNDKKYLKNKITFKKEISLVNVGYKYPKTKKEVLKKINLTIKKNSVVGIIGKSGEGKTTLVDIISGLLTPEKGHVKADGININLNILEWRKKISYYSQKMTVFHTSIKNNIAFGIPEHLIDKRNVKECMINAGLSNMNYSQNNNFSINREITNLGSNFSGGQLQKIGIARALYMNSELLILDEPTSSLDDESEKLIYSTLKNLKKKITIIIISHKRNIQDICDTVYELKNNSLKKIMKL